MITIIGEQERFNSMYYIIYIILHTYITYIINKAYIYQTHTHICIYHMITIIEKEDREYEI